MKTKNTSLPAIAFFCMFLFTGSVLKAQVLWSAAFNGGANGGGTLVKMNPDGSGFAKVYDFIETTGSNPLGSVLQATNGTVYGTCVNGGTDSSCVIYSIDPATGTYADLWNFDIAHGDYPMSGMIEGPGGMLYGAASSGGASGAGVIYSFNSNTGVYTDMYELNLSQGSNPVGSPLLASDGKLYGLTSQYISTRLGDSGAYVGYGVIYSYDSDSGTYTDLHDFGGVTDGYAFGSLIEHNGIFYGMTSGTPNLPYIVSQELTGSVFSVFPAANAGNIFSFNPATQTYTNLYAFNSTDGKAPYGSLLWATDGKLYGMTSAGGANNLGVIFSYDPGANTYSKLFDFDGVHGSTPFGGLAQSTDGNLYGVTSAGGTYSIGVAFRLNPITDSLTVISHFDSTATGASPQGGAFSVVVNPNSTAILTPVSKTSLSVYPVPAHNTVTVNIQCAAGETPLFTLTGINGQTIWGPRPETGNSQIQLNLGTLASGVYFLQATTGDNVITKKIVME